METVKGKVPVKLPLFVPDQVNVPLSLPLIVIDPSCAPQAEGELGVEFMTGLALTVTTSGADATEEQPIAVCTTV